VRRRPATSFEIWGLKVALQIVPYNVPAVSSSTRSDKPNPHCRYLLAFLRRSPPEREATSGERRLRRGPAGGVDVDKKEA
jgi:hypothetical protein